MEKSAEFIKAFYSFFYCQMASQCSVQTEGKRDVHYHATGLLNSSSSYLWSAAYRGRGTPVHGASKAFEASIWSTLNFIHKFQMLMHFFLKKNYYLQVIV